MMFLKTLQKLSINDKKKQLFLFFLGWLGLFVFALFSATIFSLAAQVFLSENLAQEFLASEAYFTYVNFTSYLLVFGLGIYVLWPWLRKVLLPALSSSQWWIGIPFTFAILFTNVILISLYDLLGITLESNQNQTAIIALVQQLPLVSFITFVILGPIVEEWTYRLGLFQYLLSINKWVAYLVTLTIFGLIHFDFLATNLLNELYNLPLYLVAGAWFCFLYDRFGLKVALTAHMTNNFLSIMAILLPVAEMVGSS